MTTKNQKIILLVEDDTILAAMEKVSLEKYGYYVITAQTGEDAIEIFRGQSETINLILMDIDLGNGLDGTETATLILREYTVPIVFLSSHIEPDIVEKTEKITAYGYVVKDSGITILDASIKMAFKLFQAHHKISESETRYRALVERIPGIVYSYSSKQGGTYYSSNVTNLLGYSPNQLYSQPALWKNSIHLDDVRQVEKAISEVGIGKSFQIRYRIQTANGEWRWLEDRSIRYQIDGEDIIIEGLALDITEQKIVSKNLQESYEKHQLLFDTMTEGIALNEMIFNNEGEMVDYRILEVNKAFYTTADYSGKQVVGNVATDLYGMSKEMIISFWKIHKEKNETMYSQMYSPINNKSFYISTSPFKNNTFITAFFDITALKGTEEKLRLSESNLKKAQKVAHVGSWSWNILANELDWSDEMYNIFDIQKETFSGNLSEVIAQAIHPDDQAKVENSNASVTEKGIPVPLEYRIIRSDGTIRTVWGEAGDLTLDETGKPILLTGIVQDITEYKLAENKIKSLLEEKEFILKEIHHRIKNNMSTIHGLLVLQANTLNDEKAIRALEDSSRRVQSMIVLYDKLYRSADFQNIAMKDYLSDLVDEIVKNFPNSESVKIEKIIEDFTLDAKRIQSLGILINELLTNIMKYAFTGRSNGLIIVKASLKPIFTENGKLVSIIIADNGSGIPNSIDFDNSTGFGLMLVAMITKQLKGNIRIERKNGTKIILEFKV